MTAAAASALSVPPVARVRGTLTVPGDKSISHRAALFNGRAIGRATVRNAGVGEDVRTTLNCLRALGVPVQSANGDIVILGEGRFQEPADVLDCGNSGTTTRLLCGALAGAGVFAVLTGDPSLRRRPMARVIEPLSRAGASLSGREGNRLLPIAIRPASGPLTGTTHRLTVASAQVKSALLLAGLDAAGPSTVIEPSVTRDHTERMLRAMGARVDTHLETDGNHVTIWPTSALRAVDVEVPGDFSSAAFWLVLGCLHPDSEIRVLNVGLNPTRTGLLTILDAMGANVQVEHRRLVAGEPVGDLVAKSGPLTGTTVEGDLVALAIDELPLVALLGTAAEGETVVRQAAELRLKESDRIAAVADGLNALGAAVTGTPDGWRVRPARLHAGRADSQGDHRIAMLLALAGTLGEGVEIDGGDAVAVSYPSFWRDLQTVAEE